MHIIKSKRPIRNINFQNLVLVVYKKADFFDSLKCIYQINFKSKEFKYKVTRNEALEGWERLRLLCSMIFQTPSIVVNWAFISIVE